MKLRRSINTAILFALSAAIPCFALDVRFQHSYLSSFKLPTTFHEVVPNLQYGEFAREYRSSSIDRVTWQQLYFPPDTIMREKEAGILRDILQQPPHTLTDSEKKSIERPGSFRLEGRAETVNLAGQNVVIATSSRPSELYDSSKDAHVKIMHSECRLLTCAPSGERIAAEFQDYRRFPDGSPLGTDGLIADVRNTWKSFCNSIVWSKANKSQTPKEHTDTNASISAYVKTVDQMLRDSWAKPTGLDFSRPDVMFDVAADGSISNIRIVANFEGRFPSAQDLQKPAFAAALKAVKDVGKLPKPPSTMPKKFSMLYNFDPTVLRGTYLTGY